MNRPKVYVTQATHHDLAPASKFGDIEVLIKSSLDQSHDTNSMIEQLYDGLKYYSDQDYLVLVGDPVAMALATSVALDINDGKVKLLKWSRNHGDYVPISVNYNF